MVWIWMLFLTSIPIITKSEFPIDEFEEVITRNDEDSALYRLPEDLEPEHYDLEITPYFPENVQNREDFTFDGRVVITVKAVKDNVDAIVIHENVRDIVTITVTDTVGTPVLINETNPFERLREYHFLKINLRDGVFLVNGQDYKIAIDYVGNINETPLSRGVFRGSYKDEQGNVHWYAATHLQPTNSRQAFPCLDEPGFKSTFDITINRPVDFTTSFSNMKLLSSTPNGNTVKEVFATTPKMAAYLVTFHISEDFEVIADNNDANSSYRIIARPNAVGQGAYALEIGSPVTKWLDDYFMIPYYEMAPDMKNDQIAVPDWASGATENWGLVSYRELRLLLEEGETNANDKFYIATITAHELAHKWFGNLVTCRWWDNVWLNEGFASYFEFFAMHGVDPTMELDDQFNIMYVQSALSSDSSAATRALQHTVNSPAEVTGHFSGISYSKGASLLLMLKHFLSEDTFKKALNYYLTDKSYQHAYPEDLYNAFSRAVAEDGTGQGVDIADFLKTWVEEPGSPILNVNVNMATGLITLEQERFFISPSAATTEQVWPIPLTYTTSDWGWDWDNTTPSMVLTAKTGSIQIAAGHEAVIFNVKQKGLYRVNYDTLNWQYIADNLRNNHTSIHHLNRAQIVDDVFALMRSEKLSWELGFQVLDFLKQDSSYYSWYPAITGFNFLRNRFLHLPETLAVFDAVVFEFLEAVIEDLGYEVISNESLTRTLNRFYIMNFACNMGHEGCVAHAREKFTTNKNNLRSVDPNIRRHVFCEGLRDGTYEDWSLVLNMFLTSNNQGSEIALLRALGCTSDERAVKEYLEMILSDEVRAQDRVNTFNYLFLGDRGNTQHALDFLKERIDDVRQAVVLQSSFNSILSNLAAYSDEEVLDDMETWLQTNQDSIPEAQSGLSYVSAARSNMLWGTERAPVILEAVGRGSASSIVLSSTVIFVSAMICMLK